MSAGAELPNDLWILVFHALWHRSEASHPCIRDVQTMTCVSRAWRTRCASAPGGSCCVQKEDGALTFCGRHERDIREIWQYIWAHCRGARRQLGTWFVPLPEEGAPTITDDVLQNAEVLRRVAARAGDTLTLRSLAACPWPGCYSGLQYNVFVRIRGEEYWLRKDIVWRQQRAT